MKIIRVNKEYKIALIKEGRTYSVIKDRLKKTGLTLDSARAIFYGLQKKLITNKLNHNDYERNKILFNRHA